MLVRFRSTSNYRRLTLPSPRPHPAPPSAASELQRLKNKNKNKNTEKSTNTWAKRFTKWQEQKGLDVSVGKVSASELDKVLQHFFAELKKQDGSDYEPDSLRTMLGALDRHFRNIGHECRIIKDKEFAKCRQVLNGKAIELREMGKGKRKNEADIITEEEEEIMWKKGVLGDGDPASLNYTVFYTSSQQFGTRGRQEHHQIRLEHLKFVKNAVTGETEYIEWVEGSTKTRQGGSPRKQRRVPQRMFAVGGDRCPVGILEKMISKRPKKLAQSGPLYLTPLQKFKDRAVWYSEAPLGVNKIDAFMKTMAALAGLDTTNKKFTNHCVRKTLVRKLQKHGISNDKIASITGHSTEQSLRDCADTDLSDHASISKILSLPHQRPQEQLENGALSLLHQPYPAHSTGCSSHSTSVASSSQYDSSYCAPIPQYHPPLLYPCSSVSIYFLFSCYTVSAPFYIISSATVCFQQL